MIITQRINPVRDTEALTGQNKIPNGVKIGLVMILVLGLAGTGFAREDKERKIVKTETNRIRGKVSGLGKDFISVVYGQDKEKGIDYEMFLPIDKNIQIQHKKNLGEIKIGDAVSVLYEDTVSEDARGEKKMERKAKVISFIKPAVKEPKPFRPPEPGEGLPDN